MKNSVLCYIEQAGHYLMLCRNRKQQDENAGKWIGVGGKMEEGESPDDCLLREVREETGFSLSAFRFRGLVTFVSDCYGTEYMHLFTADGFQGERIACDEGDLAWIPKEEVPSLPLWEGDRIFLQLLAEEAPFFLLKLVYRGDALTAATLNGHPLHRKEDGTWSL
ncbi:MAG: 8-oxo-dGTP diphosphatase [Ruminococcaceae bacterium]|nr:8-oxo-dGTP diphosphatase [Oscillospiraceae bacterium]